MAQVRLPVRVQVARGALGRGRGLLGRDALDPAAGLWISPCSQLHTFGMRFPIDVAFLGAGGAVLHVVHSMAPWRVTRWVRGAQGALEVDAGVLAHHGVGPGDTLVW